MLWGCVFSASWLFRGANEIADFLRAGVEVCLFYSNLGFYGYLRELWSFEFRLRFYWQVIYLSLRA